MVVGSLKAHVTFVVEYLIIIDWLLVLYIHNIINLVVVTAYNLIVRPLYLLRTL